MVKTINKNEIDLLNGPIMSSMVLLIIPIILSNVLQLLFNTADQIIVGRFAGDLCLAAISATSFLTSLFTNLFTGVVTGVNVVIARSIGEGDRNKISRAVHTALTFGFLAGIGVCTVGILLTSVGLRATACPEDVFDMAALYLRITFLGVPAQLVYNYGAAALRSKGDTRRPLVFLVIAGVVNVCLNILMITVFHMTVDGVAIATVASHYISAAMLIGLLSREEDVFRFEFAKCRIDGKLLGQLLKHGLPAGFQSVAFCIANLVLQAQVNAFGSIAVAANGCAHTLEAYTSTIITACNNGMITCISQNYGARRVERIKRSIMCGFVLEMGLCAIYAVFGMFCGTMFMKIFTSNPETIAFGLERIHIAMGFYAFYTVTQICAGAMRGLGSPNIPTLISLFGIAGVRLVYIFTLFKLNPTIHNLYMTYPISWIISAAAASIALLRIYKNAVAVLNARGAAA